MTTTLSWLDFNPRTWSQAIQDWHVHHDQVALNAWLVSGRHPVGDVQGLTEPLVQEFVNALKQCDDFLLEECDLPVDWPVNSMAQTQCFRDILSQVSWPHLEYPQGGSEELADSAQASSARIGLLPLLYPSKEIKTRLAVGNYDFNTEHLRLSLGFALNEVWWKRFPLRPQPTEDNPLQSGVWSNLLGSVLRQNHPRKGLYAALLFEEIKTQERPQRERGDDPPLALPTIEQILASNVPGKMSMALSQALYCPRDKIPDPKWWNAWDAWCEEEPREAQLALVSLLLNRVGGLEPAPDAGDTSTRQALVRLASLRHPPASYSIANLMGERQKYSGWTLDELVEYALPVAERSFCLFDGIASCQEQLILSYQNLQQQPQPELGLDSEQLGSLLVG